MSLTLRTPRSRRHRRSKSIHVIRATCHRLNTRGHHPVRCLWSSAARRFRPRRSGRRPRCPQGSPVDINLSAGWRVCTSGGEGSTSCSAGSGGCSVTCGSGFAACCNLGDKPRANSIKRKAGPRSDKVWTGFSLNGRNTVPGHRLGIPAQDGEFPLQGKRGRSTMENGNGVSVLNPMP
jgi:hypothetical protein